jgi:peptide/nickel transport system permease protein
MQAYILRRLLLATLTVWMVCTLIFAILRIAPGDVALMVYTQGDESIQEIDPAALQAIRVQLGLDVPLWNQYTNWMIGLVTLDWGESYFHGGNVFEDWKRKLPVTMELALMTITFSTIVAIPVGIMMALKQDTWIDYTLRIMSLGGISIPSFWFATMILVVGLYLFGWSPRLDYVSFPEDPWANIKMFIFPALTLGWVTSATKSRMMRSSMLEVLRQDYIRTAHAKGLRYFIVVVRHALKNALLPVVTIIGISFALIAGGSVIIETIFQLPGIGRFLVEAMNQRDYNIVQALVAFFSVWIIFANLMVDLTYGVLDPRVRYD